MSWQLASFLIVGVVLLAGFAWYERSRPPSQVVALVAALAALAVAGRVAFAPLPNVKPLTTDVIVFAGYALGGAPGFAVGALSALVSNFWFGQGPWTPWQMAGWGLCGVLGAALALGTRNAGRFTLAAVCGVAALAYGALLNFSVMASLGGELSLRAYGAWWLRGASFEIAHVAGNVAFALVAGPAMVRMLTRFRERFAWRRAEAETGALLGRALRGGTVAVALAGLTLAVAALAAPARAQAAGPGVAGAAVWLRTHQNDDGGFGASPGDNSSPEITCWAMLALAAVGANPLDVVSFHGQTPVDYLRSHLAQVKSPGDYARTILALESAGANPRQFGGENLVAKLLDRRRQDGSFEDWPSSTAFAVIALRGAGATGSLEKTLSWLRSAQNEDGGWGDVPGGPSNPDNTGAAMQALSSGSKAVNAAVDYLRSHQHKGGGYALGGSGPVNTPSTAWAVQGLIAAGRDPSQFRKGGASPLDYLATNQAADGHFDYAQESSEVSADVAHQTPVWVTAEAIPAAAGATFPIQAPPRAPKPKATPQTTPSQTSPESTGGAPAQGVPLPGFESAPVPPSESSGGGGGPPPGHSAPSGQSAPGAKPQNESPGGRVPEGSTATAPTEPPASSQGADSSSSEDHGSSSSPAGAIVLGLLAGCLLFAAAWAGRRGWMRWRYGL